MHQRVSKVLLSESQRQVLKGEDELTLYQTIPSSMDLRSTESSDFHRQFERLSRLDHKSTPRHWKPVYRVGQILAVMEEFVLDEGKQVLIFNDGETRGVQNKRWMWGFTARRNRHFHPIDLPLWGVRTWLEVRSCLPQLIDGNWSWETHVEQVPAPIKAVPRSRQRFVACETL